MPDLIYKKEDGVATITLNRPERRNAFSPESIIRLAEAWIDYRDDDEMRVAILTGAGDKAFCAGGDLGMLLPLFTGAKKPDDEWSEKLMDDLGHYMSTALLRPFELYKPIIAAVNGFALAGGCELLQATDIRVRLDDRIFRAHRDPARTRPRRGLDGTAAAADSVLQGDGDPDDRRCDFSGRRAHRIGFVNEVVRARTTVATGSGICGPLEAERSGRRGGDQGGRASYERGAHSRRRTGSKPRSRPE